MEKVTGTVEIELIESRMSDVAELVGELGEDGAKEWSKLLGHPAKTGIIESRIAFCLGVVPLHSGVGRLWVLYSKDIINFHLDPDFIERLFDSWMKKQSLHRIEFTVSVENADILYFLQNFTDFEMEGELKNYMPDKSNCFLYAKTKA